MRIKPHKYNQLKIRVISLIFCVLYFVCGVALSAFHSHFHRHETPKIVCECTKDVPTHFHQIAFDYNFHAKCPICQQVSNFAVIDCNTDDYKFIFSEYSIKCSEFSKKYSADYSISSSRAPPIF